MKSIKKKLILSKETIANLDFASMDNLKGGTISDPSRTTECIAQDCKSRYWCPDTSNTCPRTPACPY